MATRYIGHAEIRLSWDDKTEAYRGSVSAPGASWSFSGIGAPKELKAAVDSSAGYDKAARAVATFGGYYTSGNRREAPEWAPSEEVADHINDAIQIAMDERGRYFVRSTKSYDYGRWV